MRTTPRFPRLPDSVPASVFPYYGEVEDIQETFRVTKELDQQPVREPALTLIVTEVER